MNFSSINSSVNADNAFKLSCSQSSMSVGTLPFTVIAGLDQGTTSTRIVLFNNDNMPIFTHQVPLTLHVSKSSTWIEQDPMEIISTVLECLRAALTWCHGMNLRIGALGITNQRETLVAWSRKTNLPLSLAMVWMDSRTQSIVDTFKCHELPLKNITGLKVSTYFSVFKMKWLLENNPVIKEISKGERNEIKEKNKNQNDTAMNVKEELMFGTVDSWIIWNLTNYTHHITDITNASRTMLMDLKEREWSMGLLQLFQINPKWLPKIHNQITDLKIKIKLKLKERRGKENDKEKEREKEGEFEIPIGSVMGDQQSSLYGHGCSNMGDAKCTIGTGTFLLINTGSQRRDDENLLTSIVPSLSNLSSSLPLNSDAFLDSLHSSPSLNIDYLLEAPLTAGASTLKWFGNLFDLSVEDTCEMASSVSHSNKVIFIPSLTGLFAPDWIPDLRASFHNLGMDTNREHLARAILESIAFSIKRVLSTLSLNSKDDWERWEEMGREKIIRGENNKEIILKSLNVDGGLSRVDSLMQMIADLTGLEIKRSCYSEQTAFGVAIKAAENILNWKRSDEQEIEMFLPNPHLSEELKINYEQWSREMDIIKRRMS